MLAELGPLLFLFIIAFPLPQLDDLSFDVRIVLALSIWMATWWITEAISINMTALLPIVIFPFLNVTDIGETSVNYAKQIIFLFLGGFLLAKAVEKSNLNQRFAYTILKATGVGITEFVLRLMTWLSLKNHSYQNAPDVHSYWT